MNDYLIKDVKEFQLRTKNSLIRVGITKASHFTNLTVKDLKSIYGIGKKGQDTIFEFCLQNNITLSNKSYYSHKICLENLTK